MEISNLIIVQGCPVADGGAPCCRMCAGNWPGTKITTHALTRAVRRMKVSPHKLGCQPLKERAEAGLKAVRQLMNEPLTEAEKASSARLSS
ncbi:MAG: hypothetical protein HPY45_17380 [Anaerolineae bacterium]|nr:hypothetical protein [Anaerolineae bacterium]